MGCFPEPTEIAALSQTRRLKDIKESSEAVTRRQHNTLQILGLNKHVRSLLTDKRKKCVHLSRDDKNF